MSYFIFTLVSVFALAATIVLFFHWKKYGMGGAAITLAETVYLAVSASLLAIAFFSIN